MTHLLGFGTNLSKRDIDRRQGETWIRFMFNYSLRIASYPRVQYKQATNK